jgi:hypothetical protein
MVNLDCSGCLIKIILYPKSDQAIKGAETGVQFSEIGAIIRVNRRNTRMTRRSWKSFITSTQGILLLLVVLRFLPLVLNNGQSGWHRDELDMLANARSLDWAYISYPPLAPFIARLALTLFGPSLVGVRLFSTLAAALALLLASRMAYELGGGRWAQLTAAAATLIAPYPLLGGVLFHYSSFDILWWVLIAFLVVRLLKTENPRLWLAIGAVIGLGMLTKYTIAFLIAGLVAGVILTRARRFLASPWLWGGVLVALLIVTPTLIWHIQHDLIAVDYTRAIHARDVRIGRAEGFLVEQLIFATNVVTIPLWLAGLYFFIFSRAGRSYRMLGWMYLLPLALLLYTQGRSYYLAPAYPMLFAGGAALAEGWLASIPAPSGEAHPWARRVRGITWGALVLGGVLFAPLAMPLAPVNSAVWDIASEINGELREQIGWPELVESVAKVYTDLSPEEQARTGILAGNYGEFGALDLYGPDYGLPQVISGANSYWERGYGDPPPQMVIVVGFDYAEAAGYFKSCRVMGKVTNRFGVPNEESQDHPAILLCTEPRRPWPELWPRLRSFM